jgi:ferredoxin-type protein NapG
MDRRQFIVGAAQGTAAAACGGLLWHALLEQQASAAVPLRPPGARAERDFAATCIKCGLCVQACPYDTLRLVKAAEPGAIGTPTFTPRDVPCYMCESIPCARVCPTGALDPQFPDIAKARMGLAVIDPESCLSWQGLRCEVCYRVCPVRGQAITIANHPRQISKHAMFVPVVHSGACTGCGICEKKCPTEVAAIRIVDPKLVQGRIGAHYRLGWKHEQAPAAEPAAPAAAEAARAAPAPQKAPPVPGGLDYLNRGGTP